MPNSRRFSVSRETYNDSGIVDKRGRNPEYWCFEVNDANSKGDAVISVTDAAHADLLCLALNMANDKLPNRNTDQLMQYVTNCLAAQE